MSNDLTTNSRSFYTAISTLLGTISGFLIGTPLSTLLPPPLPTVSIILFTLLGGLIGYRKKESKFFLYFSLVVVAVLSSVLVAALRE